MKLQPECRVLAVANCHDEPVFRTGSGFDPTGEVSIHYQRMVTPNTQGAVNTFEKIVAVMGDGSFGFTCGELETVVRKNMPITFIVLSNAVYGWIKAGQRSNFDKRYFAVDFSRTDHAAVANAFGVKSYKVASPDELESVLREAISYGGPTLVDIISQPLHEAAAPVSEWIA